MILYQRNLVLLAVAAIIVLPLITARNTSSNCNRSCGPGKGNRVQYPFGFSEGCEIRLNCSKSGDFKLGDFRVQNVTADSLLIDIPPSCNRPIGSLKHLFGPNYALTWQNGLLLQNCSSALSGCVIPRALFQAGIKLQDCTTRNESLSCFSGQDKQKKIFMSYANVSESNCGLFFSSIAADANKNSLVSLEFKTLQLGWWLEGSCDCSAHANCTQIVSPVNGKPGFRCRCNEGFEGDGFNAGTRCRKATSSCSPSKYMSDRCGGTARLGILVGGIIAGASLMAVLALFCYLCRRRSSLLKTLKSTKRLLSEAAGSSGVPFYHYKEIERATTGFSEKQRLGTGAYGTVYAGKLFNDEWVAIKKIRHRDSDGFEQVINEIKLISSVSHPNLVRLLGCCIERGEQILVYEFMPNGTLCQHLQRERGTGLSWTVRLTIAAETAKAIAHLHSAINPPIYHRDIKSSNILLDHNFKSKVADFGLSRLGMSTESSHISTAPQGTPGYVDPQYHQNFHLSDKSDVYSFGVVLVEIITALKVVDFSRPQSEVNLAALAIDRIGKGRLDEIIDPLLEPHTDAWTLSSVHKVAELAFRCLAFHRDMRPSMTEVAAELEYIRLSGCAPTEDDLCIASSSISACSSPLHGSEKSLQTTVKKPGVASRRLVLPQTGAEFISKEEMKDDSSPVSVQDPWLSEQSSPSTNSLLGNVIQ